MSLTVLIHFQLFRHRKKTFTVKKNLFEGTTYKSQERRRDKKDEGKQFQIAATRVTFYHCNLKQ